MVGVRVTHKTIPARQKPRRALPLHALWTCSAGLHVHNSRRALAGASSLATFLKSSRRHLGQHTVHLLGGDVWAYTVFVYACYKCARLEEHPRKPPDPSLFRRQRTTSRRKRLAVSAFLRRRRRSAGATSRPSRAHLAHQATPRRPVQTHPALFRPRLIDPGHQQSQQTALQRSKTARNGRTRQKALLREAAERHQRQRRSVAGSVLARPAQGRFEGPLTGPARLLQRARVRSARGRAGEQVGELPPAQGSRHPSAWRAPRRPRRSRCARPRAGAGGDGARTRRCAARRALAACRPR